MLFSHISLKTIAQALPEIFMAVSVLCLPLIGAFSAPAKAFKRVYVLSIAVLCITLLFVLKISTSTNVIFSGFYVSDPFGIFSKICILLFTLYSLCVGKSYMKNTGVLDFEYPILILTSTLGIMLLASANDFLTFFIAIELFSLSLYIILALKKKNLQASEASLKYFILGALATGIMLYGITWIYGYCGATNFETIERFLSTKNGGDNFYISLGFILILAGLAFKISAAPFHNWSPDVYEGTPYPILTYFVGAPKFAIFSILLRLTSGPFSALSKKWSSAVCFVCVTSLLIGGFATLTQRSLKRFIAYSSIGQIGFALIGISMATEQGYVHTLMFLIFYIISILGFMACILHISGNGYYIKTLSDMNGIGRHHPIVASCMAFFILSMAGIPPFPGFLPKLLLLQSALHHEHYTISIIAVIYSVIAAAYYLLFIKSLFFDSPNTQDESSLSALKTDWIDLLYVSLAVFVLIALTFNPNVLLHSINHAVSMLVYF